VRLPPLSFTVLDTETTGFIPKTNRVIEFASVHIENGNIVDRYEQLIAIPGNDVPPTVQVLTRIRPKDLEGQPTMEGVREEMLKHIGKDVLIIGQNVSFDLRMLRGEGIDLTEHPWIDTSMLASLVFPELASYSLGYVSTVLQLNHEPVHRAMGDVTATLELLGKCWERILELPEEMLEQLRNAFARSSPGYRLLATALPEKGENTKQLTWIQTNQPLDPSERTFVRAGNTQDRRINPPTRPNGHSSGRAKLKTGESTNEQSIRLPSTSAGTVQLLTDSLNPSTLGSIIAGANTGDGTTWVAVKNLEATLRRLGQLTDEVRVLHPPFLLLDPAAVARLSAQEELTADEASLLVKVAWYLPRGQEDLPIHGDERAVWSGKISCTETSDIYVEQFHNLPAVVLLDQRQLLAFLTDPTHAAHGALQPGTHIVVDDASMLEDTATKAWGWSVNLDALRAASASNDALTTFTDLLQIWIDKTRNFQDMRYIAKSDLESREAKALRERIEILRTPELPLLTSRALGHLESILDPENLTDRITWVEQRQNGSQYLESVPERVGALLQSKLYEAYATTLLLPPGKESDCREVLPVGTSAAWGTTTVAASSRATLPLVFPEATNLEFFLRDPPEGKSIVLIGSRRTIEDAFIRYTEMLEQKGVTMICQNLSGGQERMQAEFLAASAPALWLLTPWTYEGVELPPKTADRLVLCTLPFDHPDHPVLSRRALHYRDSFSEYTLPRLKMRLFRLLRTFARHGTPDAEILVCDERLRTKRYGKEVREYLEQFSVGTTKDTLAQMQLL
jgi:DNA polymerase III epsilon subunit-like protein